MTNTTNMSQVVSASNRFGFNLFKSVQQQAPDENVLISPSSIAIALAMTRNGTAQETLAEMTTSLGLEQLNQTIDPSYAKLITTLQTADADVELAIANSLWVDHKITLKPQLMRNAQFYQAQVTNLT
jgi:serine protease inhibitor